MATFGPAADAAANMNPNNSIQRFENRMARRNGDDWPKDVVIDILSRLPVKSLMRFRCLKKSWCAVIQSPEFVSEHLNNYYNNSTNSSLIAECGGRDLFMFSPNRTPQYQRFDLPSRYQRFDRPVYNGFLGPCNGIFLLYKYSSARYSLWNPATKQLISLPPPPNPKLPCPQKFGISRCGFGLNPATNDFKIVAIRRCKGEDVFDLYPSRVMVYTSSSNSWRDLGSPLQDAQWVFPDHCCYTYVQGQGIYYWRVCPPKHILVSFDMGSDSFETIQMPVSWDENWPNILEPAITMYHDSLALLLFHTDKDCIDVWVMDKRNWIKQLSVSSPVDPWFLLGIWRNDWFVIRTYDESVVLWNAVAGEVKHLNLHSLLDANDAVHQLPRIYFRGFLTCRESLFSIKIGGDDN